MFCCIISLAVDYFICDVIKKRKLERSDSCDMDERHLFVKDANVTFQMSVRE